MNSTSDPPLELAFGRFRVLPERRELLADGRPVKLGGRAFDVLMALIEARGAVVSKEALMARVWPDRIIEENSLAAQIAALRTAFGAERALIRTVSGRGYQFAGEIRILSASREKAGAGMSTAEHASVLPPTNAPKPASELIGREEELSEILNLVTAHWLVTLTGAGGIGKTTLALALARELRPHFADGVWLAEFSALADPGLVPATVAAAVGLELGGGEASAQRVAQALADRRLLLVLDTCEHVIVAAAAMAEAILGAGSAPRILATSREALRAGGEWVYPVAPLAVPPENADDADDPLRYGAVRLFVERARATGWRFVPDRRTATIAVICRRLDGIPLAIELAGARAATLGIEELAASLDDRFRVLTGGRRTALPRHQTLRATLDWSYELLAESEQHLLRLLSVFPAGFTLDAAIAIVGEPAEAEPTMVEGLANLLAKSLVVSDQSIPDRRWRLLETIRAYGLEKLVETGEAKQAERRHAEFFRDLETSISLQPKSQPSVKDLSRQGREIDNIRAALDWSFSPAGDAAIGIVLAAAYVPVWLHLGLMAECRDQIERALEHRGTHPDQDARVEMQLAIALGVAVTFMMGSVEKIRDCLARGIEIAKNLDDVHAEIRALWVLWTVHFNIGGCDEAETAANQFSLTAHRADDAATILVGDRLLGNTLQYRGRQREARYYFERVLDRYVSPEDQQHTIWFHYDQRALARAMLARVLWLQGFADQAIDHAQASLEEARASAHELSVLYPLAWAVYPIRLMTGDLDGAERALAMASHLATTYNATFWQVLAHCLGGKLLIKRGDFEAGLALLGTGLDTCGRTGWTICYPEFLSVVAEGLAGLGQLVEARATIDQALQRADRGGERWYVPEILRIKGELLLRDAEDRSISPVEDCFNRALELAQEQDALFWELRVALSLARLRVTQDRQDDARSALSSVYNRFTEGFDTADLKAAKALLEALQ